MEPVRPVGAASAPATIEPPLRPVAPPSFGAASAERTALDPAVSLDLSPDAAERTAAQERRGFERDQDSQTLVFRVTNALNGDVIVQIPDEIVLKARAYARQDTAPVGIRVERQA